MTRPGRDDDPDRLYTLTGGRTRPDSDAFDLVTLVVGECEPAPGMQSEHTAILELCRAPIAVVEIAAELRLPVGITTILLSDLLHAGKITVRHPHGADGAYRMPPADSTTLEKVLVGLRNL
ncbi:MULTISPECIES: DUF742 domain-containing protein [Nocardia]|uniref:DUF742 domain-containing protein n=1 Tax=Nocardia TaxID=1817 RepID=UPI001E56A83C|nr:DUF742 domain-containing protein [Nocardia asteroides]UGT62141.1 DUF742 domain-containing protein [Nocardia asteroides]